ncbi:centromere protein U isoform X4 [Pongo pygmaeus]|uniref:centromere protein U isoform X4 n=1 Tax=Pongo pygmaeus TaxID=9600 RepID=UPI0023E2715D|nr:centromere protein U isoform X4 [Pongo pygmaeus]
MAIQGLAWIWREGSRLAADGAQNQTPRRSEENRSSPGPGKASWRRSARRSKHTLERMHSMKDKAGQKCKPIDVFDFPDDSDVSSIGRLGENEKDEEPYETFDPPLHSTAIYADEEEFSKHCGLSIPSTPPGKEAKRSSDTFGNEASEIESVKISAKKPGRKLRPISDNSESTEESDTRRKVKSAEKISTQRHEVIRTTASSELSEKPAESVTSKKTGPLSAQPPVEKENLAIESQSKTQKKGKISHDKRKKSRSKAVGSDTSDIVHVWCPEGMKTSDIKELNIVLPEFEKTHLEQKQRIESKVCKAAIDTFYFNVKEQLTKMLKESEMLKNLKRKNAKVRATAETTTNKI